MDEIFCSGFAEELLDYMDYFEEMGHKRKSIYYALKLFDSFCYEKYGEKQIFTRDDAVNFYKAKPDNTKGVTFYAWTGTLHSFTKHLILLNYDIGCIQLVGNYKEYYFIPHIYTKEERFAYCAAADCYTNVNQPLMNQMLPVIVRTLQCCGLRVSEVLNIRKSDVHLDEETPYLLVRPSKNGLQRYAPLSPSLAELYDMFYTIRIRHLKNGDDYIFVDGSGDPISRRLLYSIHIDLLSIAGIMYHGHYQGPRLHDWRHTFCVESFQQLISNGLESRNALMLVSAMMGHQHFSSTEHYLRLTKTMFPDISKALDKIYADIGQINSERHNE